MAQILLIAAIFTSSFCFAGRMGEIHQMHQSAVAFYLWGQEDASSEQFKDIRFVPAAAGQFVAVASEVYVFIPRPQWVTCTTQFAQTGLTKEFYVSSVECN